ncbi:hypothetical protein KM043_017203 [Ampulex compressa]|nr:hypothetical protein KM043_017203 [Ampulex compressa]
MFRAAVTNENQLAIENVMQSVQQIVDDPDAQVRSDLVEQLPHVAMICQEAPHLFGDVLHSHLLGIIVKYLRDADNQVRQTAQAAVLALLKRGLLDNNTIEIEICPVVEFLSYMSPDFLSSGISLMSKMAPLIGAQLTEKVFLDRYIALCKDGAFYVRKTCATHFAELCAAVGRKALFRRLFPAFIDLCCDSVWGVRKACVDVMMPVSCCVTIQHRRLLLADILATHLNDDSKWVRTSAFQILGPFISTFAQQFTEVTYNQHGELVFTSQQDNHLSIRYSYEGIFPTKCAVRSPMCDTEDYNPKDSFTSSVIIQKPTMNNVEGCNNFTEDAQSLKDYLSIIRTNKLKPVNKDLDDTDDTEKYNPFFYYYIPPVLPLDDELVKAAIKSAMEKRVEKNSSDEVLTVDSTSGNNSEFTSIGPNAEKHSDVSSQAKTNAEEFDDARKSNDDDLSLPASQIESELLNDTLDIANLSMDKSSPDAKILNKKKESKSNGQEIVPRELVDYFLSMAEPEECSEMTAEFPHYCAFSFPAVALTLGRENWPYLKKAYQSLAGAAQWKVRRTLASSIHEIAIIVGEELAATDLVPIYDGFIKDLDEVRIGVLKHLAKFLKILKPADRCRYLPRLNDFLATDNEWNWRFREELATQLLEAVTLFSPSDVAQHIAPLSLQLLIDKVAAVRTVALSLVTEIVSHLSTDEPLVAALIHELKYTLAINARKWINRQTYALVCAQLIANNAITGEKFCEDMLPSLFNLSLDKVPNVRLAVARTLSKNVITMGSDWLGAQCTEEVEKKLKQMCLDPDRDVRILAGGDEYPSVGPLLQNKTEQSRNIFF